MPNTHLSWKIFSSDYLASFTIVVLIFLSVFIGKYFVYSTVQAIMAFLLLSACAVAVLILLERFNLNRDNYQKGMDLEQWCENKLKGMNFEVTPNIYTDFGDLDLLAIKGNSYFGLEAKNWAGTVTFKNNLLFLNGYDKTKVLSRLLQRCGLVRDEKYGATSKVFIRPVLVFGYRTGLNMPGNKIMFNNNEIIVTTIADLDKAI